MQFTVPLCLPFPLSIVKLQRQAAENDKANTPRIPYNSPAHLVAVAGRGVLKERP